MGRSAHEEAPQQASSRGCQTSPETQGETPGPSLGAAASSHQCAPGKSSGATQNTPGEATPYQVRKAQELLSQAIPFMTQDAAQLVAGVHGLRQTWTEALWGEPVVLLEDTPPAAAVDHTRTQQQIPGRPPWQTPSPEPWAEWDEWAALAEKEARSHNYRDPALSSSSENDPGSLHEPPPTPHACGIR